MGTQDKNGLLRYVTLFFGAILFLLLAWAVILFVVQDWKAIQFVYPLDFGEGALLDQSLRLARFEPLYRNDLSIPPYVVVNYPPLYALIQVPFVWLFGPAFWYGRLISCVSILITALIVGFTLYTLTSDRLAGLIGGALLLVCPYVLYWSALDRIDTLALALSCAGLYVIVRWGQGKKGLVSGVILLTAAIYTRQSYGLVAPATAFIWLWYMKQRRRALQLAGIAAALNLGLFVLIDLLTEGGFYFHIIAANVNTFSWVMVWTYLREVFMRMPLMVFAALFASIGLLLLGKVKRVPAWWVITPYFCGSLVTAATIGKIGSNVNYLLELIVAFCFAIGLLIALTRKRVWLRSLIFVALAIQVYSLAAFTQAEYMPDLTRLAAPMGDLYKIVQTTPGTVLADESIGMIPLSGRELYIQPFAQKQLVDVGLWDQRPFIEAIRRNEFSAILLYKDQRAERWTDEMLLAIQSSYRLERTVAHTEIYRPIRQEQGIP